MKIYKTVPGPMHIRVDMNNTSKAFDMFAQLINDNAVDGWEYYSMESIVVTEQPGCLAKILGSAGVPTTYYLLIFSKEISPNTNNVSKQNVEIPQFTYDDLPGLDD